MKWLGDRKVIQPIKNCAINPERFSSKTGGRKGPSSGERKAELQAVVKVRRSSKQ